LPGPLPSAAHRFRILRIDEKKKTLADHLIRTVLQHLSQAITDKRGVAIWIKYPDTLLNRSPLYGDTFFSLSSQACSAHFRSLISTNDMTVWPEPGIGAAVNRISLIVHPYSIGLKS